MSNIWGIIVKFVIKKIWPIIQKLLLDFLNQVLKHLFQKVIKWVKDWMDSFSERKAKKAQENAAENQNKADEFEHKRKNSQSSEEAIKFAQEGVKYQAMADVWRKVAYDYMRENEELKQKAQNDLAGIFSKSQNDIQEKVSDLKHNDVMDLKTKDEVTYNQGAQLVPVIKLDSSTELARRNDNGVIHL